MSAQNVGVEPVPAPRLTLQVSRATVRVGEPVSFVASIANGGHAPVLLEEYFELSPMGIRASAALDGVERAYQPPVYETKRGLFDYELEPGSVLHHWFRIDFAKDGWFFERPGRYVVRIRYPLEGAVLESPPIELEVQAPRTEADRAAAELVLPAGQVFVFLGEGGEASQAQFRKVATDHPDSALAPYARLLLALDQGRRRYNPGANEFDPPQCEAALPMLERSMAEVEDPLLAAEAAAALRACQGEIGQPATVEQTVARYFQAHPDWRELPGLRDTVVEIVSR